MLRKIRAMSFFKENPPCEGDVTITSSTNKMIDGKCYTIFEVNSDKEDYFNINFWLIPAKYADGSYSVYEVLVNGLFVGKIIPHKGNWQSITLSDRKTIKLQQGHNRISVVGKAPEVPEVELIRLAKEEEHASISSENYDRYLLEAKESSNRQPFSMIQSRTFFKDSLKKIRNEVQTMRYYGYAERKNFPFRYTFYKQIYLIKGQEIFVTSESKSVHVLEFFSADNPEYLTWVNLSEKAVNSNYNQLATIRVTIPADGYYFVRARMFQNFNSGIANVNVNGTYYYENIPIFSAGLPVSQGGDNMIYSTFTKNSTSDPFIWIEGGRGRIPGNIVAYNDDHNDPHSNKYSLNSNDSYIRKSYFMPTEAVLVTAFSSNNPPGKCDVYAKVLDSDVVFFRALKKDENKTHKKENKNRGFSIEQTNIYPNPVKANSVLNISSGDNIKTAEIYDISGQLKFRKKINSTQCQIFLQKANACQPGIYVVKVETDAGIITEKLIIKE